MPTHELVTMQGILRRSLKLFTEQPSLVNNCYREYDDQYAKSGAKIGDTLKIRMPNRFTVRTGRVAAPPTITEETQALTMATQKGIDIEITSKDLTLSMDDFEERVIKSMIATLAADVEADMWNIHKDVYNHAGTPGSAINSLTPIMNAQKLLNKNLVPATPRYLIFNSEANVTLVPGLQALFNPTGQITKQFVGGQMTPAGGFEKVMTSEYVPTHTSGTRDNTTPVINGANQQGATLVLDGLDASVTVEDGAKLNINNVYAVNPMTKATYKHLQPFTVTAAAAADGSGNITLSISPSIIASGAKQNVNSVPADDATITFTPTTASTGYPVNLGYFRDAIALVTADLDKRETGECHVERYQNLSMRIWTASDIREDTRITRLDILYGYKLIRPEAACLIFGE